MSAMVVEGVKEGGGTAGLPLTSDGSAVKVDVTAEVDVDTSLLATSAKQDTAQTTLTAIDGHVDGLETAVASTNTKLDTLHADVDGLETLVTATNAALELLKQPTRAAAVTPSDATDVTATATKGLRVTVAGVVNVTYVGDSTATALGTLPAGTYIEGAFKRVNAATTATVVSLYGP